LFSYEIDGDFHESKLYFYNLAHLLTRSFERVLSDELLISIISEALIPIITQNYFETDNPQSRAIIVSIVVRLLDVNFNTDDSKKINALMHESFTLSLDSFLASNLNLNASDTVKGVAQVCSVIHTTLEFSQGRTIIETNYEKILQSLIRYLDFVTISLNSFHSNPSDSASILCINHHMKSTYDLLRTISAMFTKITLQYIPQELLKELQTLTSDILFEDMAVYLPDCKFMAGIILSWTIRIDSSSPSLWFNPLFDHSDSTMPSSFFDLQLPKSSFSWRTDSKQDYSRLSFIRGVLSTLDPQIFLQECIPANTLLMSLYEVIVAIIDRSIEAKTRIMSFQTLASWFSVVLKLVEIDSTVPALKQICNIDVFEKAFDYVFSFWEDSLDSLQHKLKDIFRNMLDIIKHQRNTLSSNSKFLKRMLECLLEADWHRKVKYDLMSYMLGSVTPIEIFEQSPNFLHICFSMMGTLATTSRISSFLNRFFACLFEKGYYQQLNHETWIIPICLGMTSESSTLRKAINDGVIGKLFEIHKPIVSQLISGNLFYLV
jgi:hypothetical protein